jgi:Polyketide cyclase / dehydrase and lipid transport
MHSLKRIAIASVAVLLLVLGIGYLLPGAWQVERTVVIRAPAAAIFPHLNSLKQWHDWTVWTRQQPDLQIEYSGPDAGVGATSRWRTQDERAVMKIMQSQRNSLVAYSVLFNAGASRTDGNLTLVSEADGTRVVWRAAGDIGRGPVSGYLALLEGRRHGNDFDDSLELLKHKIETKS